ncbi:MAG TPA: hypothetical protein VFI08_14245, partial [Spirochaetia bacterium]|nr:hypothetical protein [Spirochaetia bacterium]
MQNVGYVLLAVTGGLFAAQAALVLVRAPSCVGVRAPLLLAGALVLAGAHPLLPSAAFSAELDLVGVIWLCGALLAGPGRRLAAWAGTGAAALVILGAARLLGHGASAPYAALSAFSCAALAA